MFTYYQNILCVAGGSLYNELAVLTEGNYKNLRKRNQLNVKRRACKGTPALVEYETIPSRFKQLIENKIGHHPRKLAQSENTFIAAIEYDVEADKYYNDYGKKHHTDKKSLPEDSIRKYISTASILNAVGKEALRLVANQKGRSKAAVWKQLAENVASIDKDSWPHGLPENPRRLRDRYLRYKEEGYESLVHKNIANSNPEKLTEESRNWLLARWGDRVNVVPDVPSLLTEYLEETTKKGWKPITDQTLRNFLFDEKIQPIWYGHRYGDNYSREKFTYRHSTKMPTMRDSLWYGDGTKMNFYYRYLDGNQWALGTSTVYEVMDAYSDALLGYHISKTETHEAIYEAFKMAVQTSGHRPYQVSLDNQAGGKKLTKAHFLTSVAKMAIHTKPYNPSSKTIESAFGRFQQKVMKKHWFFTGQNIKPKKQESKQNKHFIHSQPIENFPTLPEVIAIYEQCRTEWNQGKHHEAGLPRIEMYEASENPKAPAVDEEDMMHMFWVLREKPIQFKTSGLKVKRKENETMYMVMATPGMPDIAWLRRNVDKSFWVYEDPSNPDIIKLCEGEPENLRFVTTAEQKTLTNRGIQEQEAWENEYYRKIDEAIDTERKKDHDTMQDILADHNATPEDYGLSSPGLLGIKDKKKRPKPVESLGVSQKQESYQDDVSSSMPPEQSLDDLYDEM